MPSVLKELSPQEAKQVNFEAVHNIGRSLGTSSVGIFFLNLSLYLNIFIRELFDYFEQIIMQIIPTDYCSYRGVRHFSGSEAGFALSATS